MHYSLHDLGNNGEQHLKRSFFCFTLHTLTAHSFTHDLRVYQCTHIKKMLTFLYGLAFVQGKLSFPRKRAQ